MRDSRAPLGYVLVYETCPGLERALACKRPRKLPAIAPMNALQRLFTDLASTCSLLGSWGLVALVVTANAATAIAATGPDTHQLEITPSDTGMVIRVDGELFTEYHTNSAGRPVLWPLIGPTGKSMLRSWPIGPELPEEETDHSHHRGLWFGYDQLDGIDFWHNPGPGRSGANRGRIVHREFVQTSSEGSSGSLTTRNDYLNQAGDFVCSDERELHFGANDDNRWIDFLIRLKAVDQPLKIGDSKEGAFAVRVAQSLTEDADQGGVIINSQGEIGKEAWGRPATWVDYYGPVGDETVGIAILSHPSNFRPRPRWHVRTYGLFAANPFGEEPFPKIRGTKQGPLVINAGEELRLRYRVILHVGDEKIGRIKQLQREYAVQ